MPNINILKNVVSRVNSYREQLYNEGLTAAQKNYTAFIPGNLAEWYRLL